MPSLTTTDSSIPRDCGERVKQGKNQKGWLSNNLEFENKIGTNMEQDTWGIPKKAERIGSQFWEQRDKTNWGQAKNPGNGGLEKYGGIQNDNGTEQKA